MKQVGKIVVLVMLVGFLIAMALPFLKGCNKPIIEPADNTLLFERIDSLKPQYDSLKTYTDSLEIAYKNKVNVKDSLVLRFKTKYIPYYDTITGEVGECLPKPYVDSLSTTYEGLILDADTIIKTQKKQINNLEVQNSSKDTIIDNLQNTEIVLNKKLRREQGKKWLWGGAGTVVGYVLGKVF